MENCRLRGDGSFTLLPIFCSPASDHRIFLFFLEWSHVYAETPAHRSRVKPHWERERERDGEHVVWFLCLHRPSEHWSRRALWPLRDASAAGAPHLQSFRRRMPRWRSFHQGPVPRCPHRDEDQGTVRIVLLRVQLRIAYLSSST